MSSWEFPPGEICRGWLPHRRASGLDPKKCRHGQAGAAHSANRRGFPSTRRPEWTLRGCGGSEALPVTRPMERELEETRVEIEGAAEALRDDDGSRATVACARGPFADPVEQRTHEDAPHRGTERGVVGQQVADAKLMAKAGIYARLHELQFASSA